MEQRFSEEEATALIQQAAELQSRLGGVLRPDGLTLTELKRIAEDTGIDPSFIDKALSTPKAKTSRSNGGLSEEFIFESAGALTDEDKSALVDFVRERGIKLQNASSLGTTIQAQIAKKLLFGPLMIQSRNNRTKLSLKQVPFVAYFAGLHLPLILSISLGIPMSIKLGWICGLLSLMLLMLGVGLFTALAKKGRAQARTFFEELSLETQALLSKHEPPN